MTRDEAKQASYVHMCTVHLILLEVLKVAFTASSVPPMIRLVPVRGGCAAYIRRRIFDTTLHTLTRLGPSHFQRYRLRYRIL